MHVKAQGKYKEDARKVQGRYEEGAGKVQGRYEEGVGKVTKNPTPNLPSMSLIRKNPFPRT